MRVVEADADRFPGGKRLRRLAADIDGHGRIATGAGIVKVAAQPAIAFNAVRIAGGLPDFRRAKMGTVRIRVADSLNHGKLAGVVERFEAAQAGMKSELVVELQDALGGQGEAWPRLEVMIIGKRNHRVEGVVAAGHLQDDQNVGIAAGDGLRGQIGGPGLEHSEGVGEKRGHGPAQGAAQGCGAEEFAAGF